MLTTTHEMLRKAYQGGYAVAAINTQGGTHDLIRAVCLAAQELRSPVILAHYPNAGAYSGHDWFFENARWMARQVDVPVAIHLDHGPSYESCLQMLRLGFTSIMFDGSGLPLPENALQTAQVIRACHAVGVPVEAELGELARLDPQGAALESGNVVDPEDVERFLALCAPDSLALGIGNAHGFYQSTPHIRLDVLAKCRQRTDVPFVLHGCTGMSDHQIREAISLGVAKINFGTQIRVNYLNYLRDGLAQGVDDGHAWKLSQYAEARLREDVKGILRLAGSENKA